MKTVIYGAGLFGEVFYRVISKYEKIDFFIDKYKTGTLHGINIIKPSDIKEDVKIYNSVAAYEDEVKKELNVISFVDTLSLYPNIIKEFYNDGYLWLQGKLLDDKLKEVRKLLNDKISLDFFDRWVKFREGFNMEYYPFPTNSLDEQYFIDEFEYSKRFVDCGGFIGDTIETYYKYNIGGAMISFEPDPKNLKLLNQKAKNKNVLVYPMGVSNETKILKFNSKGSGGSISEDGDIFVAITNLDDTIYNFKPDYIKMDIEGSEKDALIGAKNIIKDFAPNLAISIYHRADDLWEIPLLIKELNPNYTFTIRCHNHLALETILYCKVDK